MIGNMTTSVIPKWFLLWSVLRYLRGGGKQLMILGPDKFIAIISFLPYSQNVKNFETKKLVPFFNYNRVITLYIVIVK